MLYFTLKYRSSVVILPIIKLFLLNGEHCDKMCNVNLSTRCYTLFTYKYTLEQQAVWGYIDYVLKGVTNGCLT